MPRKSNKSKSGRKAKRRKSSALLNAAEQHRIGMLLTVMVATLHAVAMYSLWHTKFTPPSQGLFWQLIWAWLSEPVVYLVVIVVAVTPPLSYIACRVRGWHLVWLTAVWIASISLGVTVFADHFAAIAHVVWWKLS